MRSILGLCLLAGCAATPAPPLTTADITADFHPTFVSPTPSTLAAGIDIPLAPGDRIIANCAQAYQYELPEMTPDEQRDFNESVTCVLPPDDAFGASMAHYGRALRDRGFSDESGTYVQSGARIACNRTHSVMMQVQGRFIPRSVMNEDGEMIDVPGGGELANTALMFMIRERPCERYRFAQGYSEPPPPENYAAMPAPAFLDPQPPVTWGTYELPLRPGDRLVSHCAQYYREEIGSNLPPDAVPEEFARYNTIMRCIYVPTDKFAEAAAHYIAKVEADGFTGKPSHAAPDPSANDRFPSLQAGQEEWYGYALRCNKDMTILFSAFARHGKDVMMDAYTGEFFRKKDATGGRAAKLEGASYPNSVLTVRFMGVGCM